MAEDREPFLKRWARLKSEQAAPDAVPAVEATVPEASAPADAPAEVRPEDLPPIEELTAESDFTPFLQAGVPEELKRLALRKLWRSDPVFANLDGLVEYGEDFGAAFRNPGPVATLFRIGRGMPGPGDEEEAEQEAEAATEAPEPPSAEGDPADRSEPLPQLEGSSADEGSQDPPGTTG
ncbi:MAG TPA: DUF3306 domain-containing protein [Methylomirabilota bacterium]|jgi:uncharacterized protein DUF3306|nr:DUF3306 domain-containing protein [Methylomirabilota bacterium]